MLAKEYRLKINQLNNKDRLNRKELYTPFFKISYRINKAATGPKIGFIISGKVGTAVKRNRTRRLLSEAVKRKIEKFPKGIEAIVIAKSNASEATYEEISNSLDKILSKIYLPLG